MPLLLLSRPRSARVQRLTARVSPGGASLVRRDNRPRTVYRTTVLRPVPPGVQCRWTHRRDVIGPTLHVACLGGEAPVSDLTAPCFCQFSAGCTGHHSLRRRADAPRAQQYQAMPV